ncbi:hypothetical protein [Helicobacter typhlonius]|uniref:hypothetical protein n=1 Tax=Helicobacter typhlonius TaxID=76936 RepID=UPI002FE0664A
MGISAMGEKITNIITFTFCVAWAIGTMIFIYALFSGNEAMEEIGFFIVAGAILLTLCVCVMMVAIPEILLLAAYIVYWTLCILKYITRRMYCILKKLMCGNLAVGEAGVHKKHIKVERVAMYKKLYLYEKAMQEIDPKPLLIPFWVSFWGFVMGIVGFIFLSTPVGIYGLLCALAGVIRIHFILRSYIKAHIQI